ALTEPSDHDRHGWLAGTSRWNSQARSSIRLRIASSSSSLSSVLLATTRQRSISTSLARWGHRTPIGGRPPRAFWPEGSVAGVRVVGVDWSGQRTSEHHHLWTADLTVGGRAGPLTGRTRSGTERHLLTLADGDPDL